MEIGNFIRAMDRAAAEGRGSKTEAALPPARVVNSSHWDYGWKVLEFNDGSIHVVLDKDGQRFGQRFSAEQKAEAINYLFDRISLERTREEALREAGF